MDTPERLQALAAVLFVVGIAIPITQRDGWTADGWSLVCGAVGASMIWALVMSFVLIEREADEERRREAQPRD